LIFMSMVIWPMRLDSWRGGTARLPQYASLDAALSDRS
jgi:hypothetical protein